MFRKFDKKKSKTSKKFQIFFKAFDKFENVIFGNIWKLGLFSNLFGMRILGRVNIDDGRFRKKSWVIGDFFVFDVHPLFGFFALHGAIGELVAGVPRQMQELGRSHLTQWGRSQQLGKRLRHGHTHHFILKVFPWNFFGKKVFRTSKFEDIEKFWNFCFTFYFRNLYSDMERSPGKKVRESFKEVSEHESSSTLQSSFDSQEQ